jgi:hypothetical protein
MGLADDGVGACTLTTGGNAAASWAFAGTDAFTATPVAVALAGATIVTLLVTFVMFVTLVVLLMFVLLMLIRMPTAMTGGALVTTAGAVPMGAGIMIPKREPGGAGMKTPTGPMGGGPGMTPGPAISTVRCSPGGGGTKATPGGDQWPPMKMTTPFLFS